VAKVAQGELENNSRKPRDLVRNWYGNSLKKIQLTLSQGKKKGDDVADDKDDDAVKTSVSQDRVTATLCMRNCSSALSIYSSLHISDRSWGGGVWTVSTIHFVGQLGLRPPSWTSLKVTRFLIRTGFSMQFFVTREDDKAVFLPTSAIQYISSVLKSPY
jgi:hypothetical protein